MRRFWWLAGGAATLALVTVGFLWDASNSGISEAALAAELPAEFVADSGKGETLYHMGGCADCHAVVGSDGLPTGGSGLESNFGTFYAPNLTPDRATGLGDWSQADFVNAMREGISPSGQHYYPAFPYTSYSQITIEDLLHIKAYLDGLPAVEKSTPSHDLGFPFNIRLALAFWKVVGHRSQSFTHDTNQSDEWNRGSYIVNGIGHCGSCHTPRNIFLAESSSQRFFGGPPLKQGEKAAPRISGVSEDDVLNALNEWAGAIDEKSSMYLVTLAYSQHIALEDHDAIAVYLSSLPAK